MTIHMKLWNYIYYTT